MAVRIPTVSPVIPSRTWVPPDSATNLLSAPRVASAETLRRPLWPAEEPPSSLRKDTAAPIAWRLQGMHDHRMDGGLGGRSSTRVTAATAVARITTGDGYSHSSQRMSWASVQGPKMAARNPRIMLVVKAAAAAISYPWPWAK